MEAGSRCGLKSLHLPCLEGGAFANFNTNPILLMGSLLSQGSGLGFGFRV